MSRILLLDIETAPNTAYVWGAWKQNISQNQWREKGWIMSAALKWLDEDEILYLENRSHKDKNIVKKIFSYLDDADIVVAHNAKRFDIPYILGRGVALGLRPPSPFHVVDTLTVARNKFRFVSNSLANLAEELGTTRKREHGKYPGFLLWTECLNGNPEAWTVLEEYNRYDVKVLEEIYLKMRPYMTNHPNVSVFSEEGDVACPKCGSHHIRYRGYYKTKAGLVYRKFVCVSCGGWGRHRFSEKDIPINSGRNAG